MTPPLAAFDDVYALATQPVGKCGRRHIATLVRSGLGQFSNRAPSAPVVTRSPSRKQTTGNAQRLRIRFDGMSPVVRSAGSGLGPASRHPTGKLHFGDTSNENRPLSVGRGTKASSREPRC